MFGGLLENTGALAGFYSYYIVVPIRLQPHQQKYNDDDDDDEDKDHDNEKDNYDEKDDNNKKDNHDEKEDNKKDDDNDIYDNDNDDGVISLSVPIFEYHTDIRELDTTLPSFLHSPYSYEPKYVLSSSGIQ